MSASHSDAIGELRLRLLANGYEPVPITAPGEAFKSAGKRPRLDGWASMEITPPIVLGWSRDYPRDINTGIRCGQIIGVDVDVLDAGLVGEIEQMAIAMLGATPLRRIGKAPKLLLAYRAGESMAKETTPEFVLPGGTKAQVEILAKGQQFVSHGEHPETRRPYAWTYATPEETPLADVPAISAARVRTFLAAAAAMIREAGGRTQKEIDAANRPAPEPRQERPQSSGGASGFFREVNGRALADCGAWVRQVFPRARWQDNSASPPGMWRVASEDLSRGLEEDISIHPREGCQDFGTRQAMTPIDLVMEHAGAPDAVKAALTLCEWLRVSPADLGWKGSKAKREEAPPRDEQQDAATAAPRPLEPQRRKSDTLPLVWFHDIQPRLDAADFVQGVLIEASAAVIYGESNAGKTFFATDLALCVSHGMPWMGRRVEQGAVAYCVLEGGFGFRNRVEAWRREHVDPDTRLPFAEIKSAINLLDPEADTPRLIETLAEAQKAVEVPFKLIVIDTLSRALAGGNENAPEDMGALVKNMDRIREETGAAVLFIHHSGKDAARGARGHSLLRAAVDTEIEVTADDTAGTRQAKVVKQRDLSKGATFPFRLNLVVLGENRHGEQVTSCTVEEADASEATSSNSRLTSDQQQALLVLTDALNEHGTPGFPGVPPGMRSIPEEWWRDRYYARCKVGAAQKTKEKAFRRAADALTKAARVSADRGRVWAI